MNAGIGNEAAQFHLLEEIKSDFRYNAEKTHRSFSLAETG